MKFAIGDRVVWYGACGTIKEAKPGVYLVSMDEDGLSMAYESELTLANGDDDLSRWEGEGGAC